MKKVAPAIQNLARQLLLQEAGGNLEEMVHGAESACSKLCFHLARLIGIVGFVALLSRALVLAQAEVPWLRAVQVKPDGVLEGLRETPATQDRDEAEEGYVVLLAQFIGLLVLFIGETLTTRFIHEIWPEVRQRHTISGVKEKIEG